MEMILERLIALNTRLTKEQTRAFIKECPLQDYDALTRKPRLAQQAERINQTEDEEEQRRLKSWLPFRCPHYTRFRDDYRDREHIVPESFTWQTCIDIDDPELVEKANEMSERLDIEAGGRWQGHWRCLSCADRRPDQVYLRGGSGVRRIAYQFRRMYAPSGYVRPC